MSHLPAYCLILFSLLHVFKATATENIRQTLFLNGPCFTYQHLCANKKCIPRWQYCDGVNHCGDNSDELRCNQYSSCTSRYACCPQRNRDYCKCIPASWKCDGIQDCQDGYDEKNCVVSESADLLTSSLILNASKKAQDWILGNRKKERFTQKWGSDMPRIAVALYLSDPEAFSPGRGYADEITYELSLSLLSRLAQKKVEDVSTSDLASYVNAFLITCIDPRKFHVVDLVKELRKRVDAQNTTNPHAVLALCNAHDEITQRDVEKLKETFWEAQQKYRTDTQALAIIALACAAAQSEELVEQAKILELAAELKKLQYKTGTVGNVRTTALVMQALFASESQPDEDNFDEGKAIQQILRSQQPDGSFGDISNSYFVLPVLRYATLANISNVQCPHLKRDEKEAIQYLRNQPGAKNNITFSIWIGDDRVVQRSMTISVPAGTSFYGLMEYAADLDEKFRFEYIIRDRKPYITALSGLMDDPEMETFWLPFQYSNDSDKVPKPITTSPADVIPENRDHLVFWYRKDV